jgi:hypothetical protein
MAIIVCSLGANAQGFSGGIKAGVNFASETLTAPSASVTPDGIVGFHGGLYFTGMITSSIGIQPELLYSVQGASAGSGSSKVTDKYNYLNIPVLFKYKIVPAFNLHAGPQLGLILSADETQGSNSASIKDQLNSTDFSLAFGAGFDLPGGLSGGLRYSLGMSNIAKSAPSGYSLKNNNLQIYLGYRLFGK